MPIKLIEVLKMPKYAAIAVISALLFTAVYIYSQVLGIIENIDLWLSVIPWYNALLFPMLVVLFGMAISFQIYMRSQPKVCSTKKTSSATSGAVAAGFFVAQCPACASLGTLLLPVSAIAALVQFGWAINLISVSLLLFTINYLGGFKIVNK
ncbi:MAG: hypothetical protein HY513_04350 [Candidatus Aenigmarchaeota archaeon]|nr:hypothetical protein [Candidatus Aenigmarchaeota archaeon]